MLKLRGLVFTSALPDEAGGVPPSGDTKRLNGATSVSLACAALAGFLEADYQMRKARCA